MKRLTILVLLFVMGTVQAAEGMWEPKQLPDIATQLKAAGLQIDPATLTDLTEHPMNAVIDLAGCTASFVSPQGLVITNHHCSWGTLQYNSTPENDLTVDGFLAATTADEVPAAPGSRVRVTVEVTDVTAAVTGGLEDSLSGAERFDAIEARRKELIGACEKDEGHRCRVQSFYRGTPAIFRSCVPTSAPTATRPTSPRTTFRSSRSTTCVSPPTVWTSRTT